MSHQDCSHEVLASSSLGHVTACPGCGQIHLTLQYMTVRLEPGAFHALADMVLHAQLRMEKARPLSPATMPAAADGLH